MKSRIVLEVEPEIKKNIKRRAVELEKTTTDYLIGLIQKDIDKAKPVTIFANKGDIKIKS